ncbi:hypothetical protein M7I_8338 [Glarea lozoyensis 74030]|uniref:Uncharacterized protein n=1 Tax=Glarea lozoyensis (strain ATCC 74030 / MF5533) TaxID=1104152 RepID=H0EZR0_GLAL7|nr:hypothetical protein M7I_8338 [Glarea lozoyensis 74030]
MIRLIGPERLYTLGHDVAGRSSMRSQPAVTLLICQSLTCRSRHIKCKSNQVISSMPKA